MRPKWNFVNIGVIYRPRTHGVREKGIHTMRDLRRLAFLASLLFLLEVTPCWAQVTHRPITDFTSAQTTTAGWIDSADPVFVGVVDYAGVLERWMFENCGLDIGAMYTGNITEQALATGKTHVHVVLHGKNVFMRAYLYADGTPVLGYTRGEVCFQGGIPVQGTTTLTLDFINDQDPGGPLPDLLALSNDPAVLPYMESLLVNGTAQGPLRFLFETPAGTPATLHILQRGIFPNGKGMPGKDNFPAELVNVKPLL